MTTMGGRPVQTQAPPEEPPKRGAGPAAGGEDAGDDRCRCRDAKPVKAAAAPTSSRRRTRRAAGRRRAGAQTSAGSTVADTGIRGQGFGLSTGGGAGSGSSLDVADFCCPEYIATMLERIRQAWNQNQGVGRQTIVKFTIQRDGKLTDIEIERPSGTTDARHRRAARRAHDADAAAAARRLSEPDADRAPEFPIPMTKSILHRRAGGRRAGARGRSAQQPPPQPPPAGAAAAERGRRRRSPAKAARRRGSPCPISSRCRPMPKPRRSRRRSARCSGTT